MRPIAISVKWLLKFYQLIKTMNLTAIDLRLLRSFVELSRSSSYLKAAEKLNISQPALSQHMAELTSAMGVTLFEKVGRRSVLTETGRQFAVAAQQALENLDNALLEHSVAKTDIVGTLRIGVINTYSKTFAVQACATLTNEYAGLKIDLREMSCQDILRELEHGNIDIGVLPQTGDQKSLVTEHLFTEVFGIIGLTSLVKSFGSTTSQAMLKNKKIVMLNSSFWTRQQIDRQAVFDKADLELRLEVSGVHNVIAILRQGDWLSIGSWLNVLDEPALGFVPLKGKYMSRKAVICYRTRTPTTRAMTLFKNELHEKVKKLKKQFSGQSFVLP